MAQSFCQEPEGLVILRPYRGQPLVIRQSDHARQCAAFVRRWGSPACDRPALLDALALAAGERDNGWDEWDDAPAPLRKGGPDDTLRCGGDRDLTLKLSPYPFDESPLVFAVPARLVPDQRYDSIEQFVEACERAGSIEAAYRAVA